MKDRTARSTGAPEFSRQVLSSRWLAGLLPLVGRGNYLYDVMDANVVIDAIGPNDTLKCTLGACLLRTSLSRARLHNKGIDTVEHTLNRCWYLLRGAAYSLPTDTLGGPGRDKAPLQ